MTSVGSTNQRRAAMGRKWRDQPVFAQTARVIRIAPNPRTGSLDGLPVRAFIR